MMHKHYQSAQNTARPVMTNNYSLSLLQTSTQKRNAFTTNGLAFLAEKRAYMQYIHVLTQRKASLWLSQCICPPRRSWVELVQEVLVVLCNTVVPTRPSSLTIKARWQRASFCMEHAPAFAEPCAALERCLQVFLPVRCSCHATHTPQLLVTIMYEVFQMHCLEPLGAELLATQLTRVQCRIIGGAAFTPTCLAHQFAVFSYSIPYLLRRPLRGSKETVASAAFQLRFALLMGSGR